MERLACYSRLGCFLSRPYRSPYAHFPSSPHPPPIPSAGEARPLRGEPREMGGGRGWEENGTVTTI